MFERRTSMPTTTRSSGDLTLAALDAAVPRARRYVETIADRLVTPSTDALAKLSKFHEPFPEHGAEASDVVATLDELGSPATIALLGRRHLGLRSGVCV